ncbi:beta-ketoacyl-[acyl-carrier-protein] synthase family protein [Streptomyces sp. NPDC020490]|uniref:beta-ketoacyl-[acyl-carrier-protein] synthase family protein n=1 Tax=Streptomyces sp. NPDC020490 TaxID=3365078 RepID=UPI0037AAD080
MNPVGAAPPAGSAEDEPHAQQDVVVTGLGIVAGDYLDPDVLFDHLAAGGSLVAPDPRMAGWGLPGGVSARVPEEARRHLEGLVPAGTGPLGPAGTLGWYAADSAWADSGLGATVAPERVGVFVGCNRTMSTAADFAELTDHCDPTSGTFDLDTYLDDVGPRADHDVLLRPTTLTTALARQFDAGVAETHAAACAAGATAIGSACRDIRSGRLDVALAGGTESLTTFAAVVGFLALGALALGTTGDPTAVSRPFDKDRTGFVIGDAAAFLVLESRAHARRRGARTRARIAGFAGVSEAVRITASSLDGQSYADCMRLALDDAGLEPTDIGHVNAHGTATATNDRCEAAALALLFGERVGSVPVTANKSAVGHTLAGSGAVEAVLSVLTLQRQTLLPTLNHRAGDEVTSVLDVVTEARTWPVSAVLSNSFGFGGQNSSLVFTAESE